MTDIQNTPTKDLDLNKWQKFVDFIVDDTVPKVNVRIVNTYLEQFQGLLNDYLHNLAIADQRLNEVKEGQKFIDKLSAENKRLKEQLQEAHAKKEEKS